MKVAEIEQTMVADIVGRLPQLIPWDSRDHSTEEISLLIVCAGFEDRAVAIVDAIGQVAVEHLLIIAYPTNEDDNREALTRLRSISATNSIELTYDRSSFLADVGRHLDEACLAEGARIVVDVSGMASYVSSRLLKAIWERCTTTSVRMFYAEAIEYHPTCSDWDGFFSEVADPNDNLSIAEAYEATYFQSRGVDETYECDAFPGANQGPLATQLVAIPSFSLQRVKSMTTFADARYNVTPESICWFLGSPPDKERNGWRFDAMARLYNVQSGGIAVDTRDYRDVLRKLDEAWCEALDKEYHLVIGGMGSKMQNIGVFLFLMMHPECGLLHCEPSEFIADRYTEGVGPQWCLDIGRIESVATLLQSRGRLSFRW